MALLVSLTALWVFAAWVTLREGVNLLFVQTMDSLVAPSDPMLVELQRERRLSVVGLASGRPDRAELAAQRARTDKTIGVVVKAAQSGSLRRAADAGLEQRLDAMVKLLRQDLGRTRQRIDTMAINRHGVTQSYAETVESVFRVYDSMSTLDDKDFATDLRSEVAVNRTWEMLSHEDAVVAGVLATGRITYADQLEIAQIVGARRVASARAMVDLAEADRVAHAELTDNVHLSTVRGLEDQLAQRVRAGQRPRVSAEQWRVATEPALAQMRKTIQDAGDRMVARATPIAIGVIIRLMLAGGLGLLAVIASIVVSITTARSLVRQLEKLRRAAHELADERLPGVVERLGHGEKVDVAAEAPPLRFGNDEIGQVGQAFNAVQETAIRTAVEQAELRRGIRDVLLSLARRTQTLVHRQLSMLDTMERRRDIDPKHLEELFRLDHLATRMRRNAENLIVLSGAIPARGWRRSVPMVDVVRAAVGEVEDYTRVSVLPFGEVELAGRAVGDLTHLLAELIENAVSFSPPDTVVQIGGHLVASGFAIDIEDRGLGMTDEKLAEINQRIAHPPEFNLQSSVQLGLFVVGKLAERYGLQVQLKRSAYGGTTAVVVIPQELIVEASQQQPQQRPVPVTVGATTQNGLAVRQPSQQPALVAVPGPGSGPEQAPQHAAPEETGPRPFPGPGDTGPRPAPLPQEGDTGPRPAPLLQEGDTGPRPAPLPQAGDTGPRPTPLPQEGDTGPRPAPQPPAGHQPEADPLPRRTAQSEPAEEDQPPVPEVPSTPSGLPVRVPQASLAPPLRTDEPLTAAEPDAEPEEPARSPAEIQRIMGSYQRGTRRGRSEAAEVLGNNAEGEDEQ
ncbi:nitrate- and nitrite sensing domain-containing protein [Spirillospora sp. CA-253888]